MAYKTSMFWLGGDSEKETKLKRAADGVDKHRNQVLKEVLTELNKLRSHMGRVTWRDVVDSIERLKV
jgi:hypothetical protein